MPFNDPDPKRLRSTMSSSTFFSPNKALTSSENPQDSQWRRKPLHRRSKSKQNEQQPAQAPEQPTVRLVDPTPSPPQTTQSQTHETDSTSGIIVAETDDGKENWEPDALPRLPLSAVVKEASVPYPRISAASRHSSVSEPSWTTNEAPDIDGPPSITLVSDTSAPAHELPKPIWHRRSTSSGDYSQSSTLHDSEIAFSKKSLKSERLSSLSQLSTLRGTPSPYEHENKERAENEGFSRVSPGEPLHTLQEVSPERPRRLSTIRAVSPSETSSPSKSQSETKSLEPSPLRPRTYSGPSNLEQPPNIPPRTSSRRNLSTGSIPSSPIIFAVGNTVSPSPPYRRSESRAISEGTPWQPSSPNFIAYTPDSARLISRDPLRNATSDESINSRLQFASAIRPETRRSLATTSSWGSLQSNDTLPPLQVPKKRLRHKAGSESLSSLASSSRAAIDMDDDDIDTLPYPKRPFSTHLSTIASESETGRSRTVSQHLSHFSLGSGVLTGDDSSSLPVSPTYHRRTDSAPAHSEGTRGTSSSEFEEEVGDMTLGIYREESAIPQPLFRANVESVAMKAPRKYDGPLPPMPPVPPNAESDEHVDTLSALQSPPLRQQRSGKSLRGKSNITTPGHSRQQSQISYVDSDRHSQASSLFPTWAKHFYSGNAALASKASFGSLSTVSRRPNMHRRNDSSWTEQSITSRLGNDYDNVEPSPTSSHFLPSIFRTRKRAGSHQQDSRSSKIRKSGRSRPSEDRPSQDSMAIQPMPPLEGTPDILPSGQPRWGVLKDPNSPPDSQRRPLPRKYSKQRQWDHMEFPRPMTKDRLSDFHYHEPHLAPSKRISQNHLSAWQAPSFVSGLDTLITSRCNRQIFLFMLGFVCPVMWMLGAVLPLPRKPASARDLEQHQTFEGSEEDVQIAMMKHEAGDAERRWREERTYLKARWWRMLNRIMSVIGLLVIGAVIALVVVATT